MIRSRTSTVFTSRLARALFVAAVVLSLMLFIVMSLQDWQLSFHDGITLRRGISVTGAELRASDKIALDLDVCEEVLEVVRVEESGFDVQVKVVANSFPFRGRNDCGRIIEVQLQKPFGDRVLVDKHTGQTVRVRKVDSLSDQGNEPPQPDVAPPAINDPPTEAELQDLQRIADQKGMSLQEAIDRYAWNDNFSLLAAKIREAFPAAFAGAEIVDDGHAWIGFAGPAPEEALDIIDIFSSSHSGVSVEVRAGIDFTEEELQKAIPAAHYAVYESPEVRDATTSFDYATGRITTIVILESTASDSVLNDLQAAGTRAITGATGADILDSIMYSVIRSNSEVLGGLD